jgi:hypothetical protein
MVPGDVTNPANGLSEIPRFFVPPAVHRFIDMDPRRKMPSSFIVLTTLVFPVGRDLSDCRLQPTHLGLND